MLTSYGLKSGFDGGVFPQSTDLQTKIRGIIKVNRIWGATVVGGSIVR
jgi:hypothetical protein